MAGWNDYLDVAGWDARNVNKEKVKTLMKRRVPLMLVAFLLLALPLQAEPIFPGLTGAELIDSLQAHYSPDPAIDNLNYDACRDTMYAVIDNHNLQLEDVYTGYTIDLDPATSGDPSTYAYNHGINAEHTWPQSMFDSDEPLRSDMHHLFPCWDVANSTRNNYPFAEIDDNLTTTWLYNGTTTHVMPPEDVRDQYSEYWNAAGTDDRFEVREVQKGNTARAVFYFWMVYHDHPSIVNDASDNQGYFDEMKDDMLLWHEADPPDSLEIARSHLIAEYQGNDNPFVLDTTLVRRAYFPGTVDSEPPLVTISLPEEGGLLINGSPAPFAWTAEDASPLYSILLDWSGDEGATWSSIDSLDGAAETFDWLVPSEYHPWSRVRVTAVDLYGNAGADTVACFLAPDSLSRLSYPGMYWSMMALPLNPENGRVDSLFGDDLSGDASFVTWDASRDDYNETDSLRIARGYWVATEAQDTLTMTGTPATWGFGQSLAQGWNLAANSLPAPIPRDSLVFVRGTLNKTYHEALDAGWILPGFYDFYPLDNRYVATDMLYTWRAYQLYATLDDITLLVRPPHGTWEDPEPGTPLDDWKLILGINHGRFGHPDTVASIGTDSRATVGFDTLYDRIAPPNPPGDDWQRVLFVRHDWLPGDSLYLRDVRPPLTAPDDSASWEFVVRGQGAVMDSLYFPGVEALIDSGYSVTLFPEQGNGIDIGPGFAYSVDGTEDRGFRITVRREDTAVADAPTAQPLDFAIEAAWPNPFNERVSVRYSLPQSAEVQLAVYDILGRRVATLQQGRLAAGRHTVSWNAQGVASGVYFLRLNSAGQTRLRKVVLVR